MSNTDAQQGHGGGMNKSEQNSDTSVSPFMAASQILMTPSPEVSEDFAISVAATTFGLKGRAMPLTSERDRNFLIVGEQAEQMLLKFVHPGEPDVEMLCQIAVLEHMSASRVGNITPAPLRTVAGESYATVHTPEGIALRVRAYSFLSGRPATQVAGSAALRKHLGRRLGEFDLALSDFSHPGTDRTFLWDLMQVPHLRALTHYVPDADLRQFAETFIDIFVAEIAPALQTVRHQVVHNDLSKSNFLVAPDDDQVVSGILDFGDMAFAPLINDLAIAASYQIGDAPTPMQGLEEVMAGFEGVMPLEDQERALVFDLVMARLVQRLVITEWRAALFPENRVYIMRANPEARRLLQELAPVWQARRG